MQRVTFELPDEFVVREAVCVIAGWSATGEHRLRIEPLDEESLWTVEGLLSPALRRTRHKLDNLWGK